MKYSGTFIYFFTFLIILPIQTALNSTTIETNSTPTKNNLNSSSQRDYSVSNPNYTYFIIYQKY